MLVHINVDQCNGRNSVRREKEREKKKSSAPFPLTGNCVFDSGHHTHLVLACNVSLLAVAYMGGGGGFDDAAQACP